MNGSVSGTPGVIKRSAVFVIAIGLFFCAGNVIGQTSGSRSNPVASSQSVNDRTLQSGSRYQRPAAELLSDTQGVDFSPYMRQALQMMGKLWLSSVPADVARANQSQTETVIRFTISRDGTISDMTLVKPSGLVDIDRAAWGSITGVGNFPSLPAEFNGPNLVLRVGFRVNPLQQ
jgi:TonB family protein